MPVAAGAGDESGQPRRTSEADDAGRADETNAGGADEDEICSICLDVYDNPVQLPCGHSFCSACLDGWHDKSKYDVHQPRNCPVCRRRAKPSREIISQLDALAEIADALQEEGHEDHESIETELEKLLGALLKMGYTSEEITDMVTEYQPPTSNFQSTSGGQHMEMMPKPFLTGSAPLSMRVNSHHQSWDTPCWTLLRYKAITNWLVSCYKTEQLSMFTVLMAERQYCEP